MMFAPLVRSSFRAAKSCVGQRSFSSSIVDAGSSFIGDFRSDTLTLPDTPMRLAMSEAPVGDDVYGEDPSVNEIERHVAGLLGKEAALLVPSGTMGNLVSIGAVCGRGDELLVADKSHINLYEGGGASTLLGAKITPLPTGYGSQANFSAASSPVAGEILPEQVTSACFGHRTGDIHFASTRMLCLENTNVACGGSVLSLDTMRDLRSAAHDCDLHVHLDGARLFNAATALGCSVKDIANFVDSGTFCLSKGLGCPMGSMVFGSEKFIAKARAVRKTVGGGMRQAGIIAAAGLYALEHNVQQLAVDHANARLLADNLQHITGIHVVNPDVQSNIVYARITGESLWGERSIIESGVPAADCVEAEVAMLVDGLNEAGFNVGAGYANGGLRFVTHRDVTEGHVVRLTEHIDRLLNH